MFSHYLLGQKPTTFSSPIPCRNEIQHISFNARCHDQKVALIAGGIGSPYYHAPNYHAAKIGGQSYSVSMLSAQ